MNQEWKNGDVVRSKDDHSIELLFVGKHPQDGSYFIAMDRFEDFEVNLVDKWELKPQKVTRWIGVTSNGEATMHYASWDELESKLSLLPSDVSKNYQIIEIEVEM